MDKPNLIRQHSSDGDMLINPNMVCALRISGDMFNYEVLLSDGEWYRTFLDKTSLKNYFDSE